MMALVALEGAQIEAQSRGLDARQHHAGSAVRAPLIPWAVDIGSLCLAGSKNSGQYCSLRKILWAFAVVDPRNDPGPRGLMQRMPQPAISRDL
jgi:hypothetical protein